VGGGKGVEHLLVALTDGDRGAGVGLIEVGGEIDEIGDGGLPVAIEVAFLPRSERSSPVLIKY